MNRTFFAVIFVPIFFGLTTLSTPASIASAAQAGPNEGLVVFTRADVMGGRAIRFNIEQDGRPIGQLLAGTTMEIPLAPGSYTFSVRAPSLDGQDYVTINVQAGWTYHVEGKVLLGWPTGRPKFNLVSESPGSAGTVTTSSQGAIGPSASSDALAAAALGSVVPQPAATGSGQTGRTAEDMGRIGLRNFVGDWDLDMWSLATDGSKLEGSGAAKGTAEGDDSTQILITDFAAATFPEATGGGRLLISHVPEKGFTLESRFRYSNEVLRFSGQYQADTGRYVFYLFTGSGGQTATGMTRSSVRVEIRSLDIATWVADTYSSVDGQSIQVQSYRFTRR